MLGGDKRPLKKGMKVVQDVKTRWNSTTIMLQRILYLRPAVEQYCLESKFGFLKLTSHEWKQVEYLIAVSRTLALCTTRISESKGATLAPGLRALQRVLRAIGGCLPTSDGQKASLEEGHQDCSRSRTGKASEILRRNSETIRRCLRARHPPASGHEERILDTLERRVGRRGCRAVLGNPSQCLLDVHQSQPQWR